MAFLKLSAYPDLADCEIHHGANNCASLAAGSALPVADLKEAKAAILRGVKVVVSKGSWPDLVPGNVSPEIGGASDGNAKNYANLASALTGAAASLTKTYGIPVYAVSLRDEPDRGDSYPSGQWTAQETRKYIPYLTKALSNAGYCDVKIMVAERRVSSC